MRQSRRRHTAHRARESWLTSRAGRAILITAAAAVSSTWLGSSRVLDRGAIELLPFTAPGAVFGLWMGWLAHAFVPSRFTWRRGFLSACAGAAALPPWLGALVVLVSGADPIRLLVLFNVGAWVTLVLGLVAALVPIARRGRLSRRVTTTRRPST